MAREGIRKCCRSKPLCGRCLRRLTAADRLAARPRAPAPLVEEILSGRTTTLPPSVEQALRLLAHARRERTPAG
jgi:hypothetical protein